MKTTLEIIKTKYRSIDYTITYVSNLKEHFDWDKHFLLVSFSDEKVVNPGKTGFNANVYNTLKVEDFFQPTYNKDLLRAEAKARKNIDAYWAEKQVEYLKVNRKHFDKVFSEYASPNGERNKASYKIGWDNVDIKIEFNTTKTFNIELIKSLLKKCNIDTKFLMTYEEMYPDARRYYSSTKKPSHILFIEGYTFNNIENAEELRAKRKALNAYKNNQYPKSRSMYSKNATNTPKLWNDCYNNRQARRNIIAKQNDLDRMMNEYLKQIGAEGKYKFEYKLVKVK